MVNPISNLTFVNDFIEPFIHPLTLFFHQTVKPQFKFSVSGYAVSLLRIPLDIIYIVKKKYEGEHSILAIIGNFLLMPADLGGGAIFLNEISLINLAYFSEVIGKIPVIGYIVLIPLAPVVSLIYISGYTLLCINSILILFDGAKNDDEKRQSLIDLATCISQIALALLFLVGYSYTPVLLVLGIVAGAIGALGFIHRIILIN